MKAVLQRVTHASVSVEGEVVGEIAYGLLVLLGVMRGDTSAEGEWLAKKTAELRVFEDEEGRMNRSLLDLTGEGAGVGALVVSQFTLAADGRKGRRPSFDRAAAPEIAEPLYRAYCDALRARGILVATGKFRALMEVSLTNVGPATFVLERVPEADRNEA
ncbi:MAG: D-aminoacyl-tRNA deacylase [Planctomycetota bacterium]